ncbi:MAG: ABC transporter permease [Eubacteriales bacterium]
MKKFFTVFKFEFSNLVKSKPFIILSILVVVGMGIAMSYPRISQMIDDAKGDDVPVDAAMTMALINESVYDDDIITGMFASAMPDYEIHKETGSIDDAKQMIKDELYGYVLYLEGENDYTLVTESIGLESSITYRVDGILLDNYKAYLLAQQGLEPDTASQILKASMNADVFETGKNQSESFLYTYILLFFLYMIIIIYGQMVATSVATEKSSRAMEVLVTTIDPVRMMFGKVLGIGAAALCQVAVVVASGAFFFNLNQDYLGGKEIIGTLFNIPTETLVISLILIVLGFFVYAFLYAAVGSLVSRIEDVSSGVLPITFISIGAFMAVMFSMTSGNLDSVLMKIFTYFPLTSPYALLVRMSMTDVGLLEGVGAIALLLVTCIIIGYIAAMIYKLGVLMYGKPPKLKEVFKLLKTNKKA